jgi:hypothetical protein
MEERGEIPLATTKKKCKPQEDASHTRNIHITTVCGDDWNTAILTFTHLFSGVLFATLLDMLIVMDA